MKIIIDNSISIRGCQVLWQELRDQGYTISSQWVNLERHIYSTDADEDFIVFFKLKHNINVKYED